ncbi:MAG: transposase [Elusimicrobia bacterium]|nr:transposase [Elusimicrobiota bacterium]
MLDHIEDFALALRRPQDLRHRPPVGVLQHLQKYLECGIARFGVMRFRCPQCGEDLFVAFSCKRRGFCPHCDAKRAAIIMADASDRLLPAVGYRQYVLTIPKRLRWYVNQSAALPGEISRILAREIERLLRRRCAGTAAAQLHFIQRAGRSLNLHPHVHAVVSEGRFSFEPGLLGSKLRFHAAAEPSERDIELMTESLRHKILRRLRRLGAIPDDMAKEMLSWQNSGFSLHAKVFVPGGDREGLERVLFYCAKPALAPKRLSYQPKNDRVVYRTEPKNGLTLALRFEPVEFLRRWGLLIPPARRNLLRYYGALGPNSPLRASLVAEASRGTAKARLRKKVEGAKEAVSKSVRSWAACLNRVFEVDPLVCPRCAATMVPVAVIMNDQELVRLLEHLGLPTEFPKTMPARTKLVEAMCGPPGEECQLDPRSDLYEAVDVPPADDFHSA